MATESLAPLTKAVIHDEPRRIAVVLAEGTGREAKQIE